MEENQLWQKLTEHLKKKLSRHAFQTHFSGLRPVSFSHNILTISVDDSFLCGWLTEHYQQTVNECLQAIGQPSAFVNFTTPSVPAAASAARPDSAAAVTPRSRPHKHLCPDYTFGNFIIGESNQFAYAAGQAVATQPGKTYNPMLIYGGSGLGKTHLLQAIGNHILSRQPGVKLYFLTCEKYINEFIEAITRHRIKTFQNKYRTAEVLLIDDIQFLAGKEKSTEEFFHTFNALYESRCQVVMTSDRPPKEINQMDDRMKTRLEWGLLADIRPPAFETRLAILKSKLSSRQAKISDEVLGYIAGHVSSNIRELEGALLKLIAAGSLTGTEITVANAQSFLKDFIKTTLPPASIRVDDIITTVAKYFNISVGDLAGARRSKNLVLPRHIAMYLSRKLTVYSLPELGVAFGGRDHVTIMHAQKKIAGLLNGDTELKQIVTALEARLR